ncbi:unnamed protein product, partial [Mesorhabditis spiculigera]
MVLSVPLLDKFRSVVQGHVLDDPVDRLNYRTAALVLSFFAILVSAEQFAGSPIKCWMPQEFGEGWSQYVHQYCFTSNTYFVRNNDTDTLDSDHREQIPHIAYYQWVPFMLAVQALCFYLPNWLWTAYASGFSIDLANCVEGALKAKTLSGEARQKEIELVAITVSEGLGLGESRNSRYFRFRRDYLSNTLTWLYIVMKCLYVVNIVAQLCLLNRFLGTQNHLFWGFNVFRSLLQGMEWDRTGLFPRVTFCDLRVHQSHGTPMTYTVQCVLPLNMLNEKLFVLMWAMLALLLPITTLNAIYALVKAALPRNGTLNKWLKHGPVYELGQVRRFASEGLQGDGMLVLGFVENHAGLGVTREVTGKLWVS